MMQLLLTLSALHLVDRCWHVVLCGNVGLGQNVAQLYIVRLCDCLCTRQ